jgi:hypothetical protein
MAEVPSSEAKSIQVPAGARLSLGGGGAGAVDGGEVFLPFPTERHLIRPATQFRSTPIVTSIETLRAEGHFARYAELLGPRRDETLLCAAGTWMAMSLAREHYQACEALGLSLQEQYAMGRAAGARAGKGWLATFLSLARGSGMNWSLISQTGRVWKRMANGGGVAAYRLGPKEARLEFVGCELFDIPYFRNGFRGLIDSLGGAVSQRHHTHELPRRVGGEALYRVQWV